MWHTGRVLTTGDRTNHRAQRPAEWVEGWEGWVEMRNDPVNYQCSSPPLFPFLTLHFSDLKSKVTSERIILSITVIGNVILYLFAYLFPFLWPISSIRMTAPIHHGMSSILHVLRTELVLKNNELKTPMTILCLGLWWRHAEGAREPFTLQGRRGIMEELRWVLRDK